MGILPTRTSAAWRTISGFSRPRENICRGSRAGLRQGRRFFDPEDFLRSSGCGSPSLITCNASAAHLSRGKRPGSCRFTLFNSRVEYFSQLSIRILKKLARTLCSRHALERHSSSSCQSRSAGSSNRSEKSFQTLILSASSSYAFFEVPNSFSSSSKNFDIRYCSILLVSCRFCGLFDSEEPGSLAPRKADTPYTCGLRCCNLSARRSSKSFFVKIPR